MKRYQFRLATLQKVREARRDQARLALAEALRAEQLLGEQRSELAAEENQLRELQRSASTGRYLDVNRLLEAQRYELTLTARSQEIARHAALVEAEIERRRQALVEADREVRVLELLEGRQRRDHNRQAQRVAARQLDEIAVVRRRRQ